jgi:hypothetical protein
MNKKITAMMVVLALAGMAQAATVVQTLSTGVIAPGSDTVTPLTFNAFNSSLGTLTSVTITMSVDTWGGYYTVVNATSPLPGTEVTGNDNFGITARAASGDVTLPLSLQNGITSQTSGSFDLLQSGNSYRLDGPANQGSAVHSSVQNTYSSGLNRNQFRDDYLGASTFGVSFHSGQVSSYTASGFVTYSGSSAYSDGSMTITYTYTPSEVPEPASMALFGVGVGVLALRRRFGKKA